MEPSTVKASKRRRRPAFSGDSRDSILEAARARFLRFGPRKTTMEEVARDSSCSRATVYLHFSSKELLYARLLEEEVESFLLKAQKLLARDDEAVDKLLGLSRLWLWTYRRNPLLASVLAADRELTLPQVADPILLDQEQRLISHVEHALNDALEKQQIRRVATDHMAVFLVQSLGHLVERDLQERTTLPFKVAIELFEELLREGLAA